MAETVLQRATDTAAASEDSTVAIQDMADQLALSNFETINAEGSLFEPPRFDDIAPSNPFELSEEEINSRTMSLSMARRKVGLSTPDTSLEEENKLLRSAVMNGQEAAIRMEIADKFLARLNEGRTAFVEDGIRQGTLSASNIVDLLNDETLTVPTREALRGGVVEDSAASQAVETAVASSPVATQRSVISPDYIDQLEQRTARSMRLQSLAQKYSDKLKDDSFLDTITEGLSLLIPFRESLGIRNKVPGGGDSILPSENIAGMRNFLMNTSEEEFTKTLIDLEQNLDNNGVLTGSNEIMALHFLNLMVRGSEHAASLVDFGLALDVSTLPLISAVKALKHPVTFFRTSGARDRAATVNAQNVSDAQNGARQQTTASKLATEPEQLATTIDELLPGLASTERAQNEVGVSGATLQLLDAQDKIIKQVLTAPNAERLTPDELNAAVAAETEFLRKNFVQVRGDDLVDIGLKENPVNNVRTLEAYLGTGKGRRHEFISEEAARAAAKNSFGLEKGFEVVEKNNLFFIKVSKNVDERGFIQAYGDPRDPVDALTKVPGFFQQKLTSPNTYLNDVLEGGRKLSVNQQQLLSTAFKAIVDPIGKLSKAQAGDLQVILAKGIQTDDGKVFKINELKDQYRLGFGREPSTKEVNAYYSFQNANRMVWMIRNARIQGDLARKGFEKFKITSTSGLDLEGNARVLKQPGRADEVYVYDAAKNTVVKPGERSFSDLDDQFVMIETQFEQPAFKKFPIKHILVRKEEVDLSPVDWIQLNYRPGGSIDYGGTGKFWLKQTRSGTFDDGKTYLREPRAHHVFQSKDEAAKWAENYNESVVAFKAMQEGRITTAQAEEIVQSRTPYTLDEFTEKIEDGTISTKHKFEVTTDRQPPDEHLKLADQSYSLPFDEAATLDNYYRTNRIAYSKRRGDRLINPDGTQAQVLSPLETLKSGIEHAVGMKAFYNLTNDKVERWIATYSPWLTTSSKGKSPLQTFMHGKLEGDSSVIDAAEAIRGPMIQLLNTRTRTVDAWESTMNRMADKMAGIKLPFVGENMERGLRKVAEISPVESLRRLAFHNAFFGDISQFLVQSQTAIIANIVEPAFATASMRASLPMYVALKTRFSHPKAFSAVMDKQAPVSGMSRGEFKEMYETIANSGQSEVGGTLTILDQADRVAMHNGIMRKGKQIAELGEFAFFETERFNRTVGAILAFKKLRARDPNFDFKTARGAQEFAKVADDLAFNMTRASNAPWQQGLATIPTQFSSYMARYVEMMLPAKLGGNPAFSGSQKAGLLLSQMVLYGAAGGLSIPRQQIEKGLEAAGITDETSKLMFTEGLYDSAIQAFTGGEIDTASRLAVLGGPNLIVNMLDPDVSFMDVAGGPSIDMATRAFKGVANLIQLSSIAKGEQPQIMSRSAVMDMAGIFKSTSRALRSYIAMDAGEYFSGRSGQLLLRGLNPAEATALFLGFQPRELSKMYERVEAVTAKEEQVEELATLVARNLILAGKDEDSRQEELVQKMYSLGNVMSMVRETDPEIHGKVMRKVVTKMSSETNQKVLERFIRRFGLDNDLARRTR